jgi:hypothetical protein
MTRQHLQTPGTTETRKATRSTSDDDLSLTLLTRSNVSDLLLNLIEFRHQYHSRNRYQENRSPFDRDIHSTKLLC